MESRFYYSYLTGEFFFETEEIDPLNEILPLVNKLGLESELQHVVSVYDEQGERIQNLESARDLNIITLTILMMLLVTIGYLLGSTYYQENKFKIYIKKLLGYGFLRRMKNSVLTFTSLDIFTILGVFIITENQFILVIGTGVILLNLIFLITFNQKLDVKNFNIMIKGER